MPHLFESLQLRDIALPNRIGIPPMCQYSAQDGLAADWHFVHYGSRAVRKMTTAAVALGHTTAWPPQYLRATPTGTPGR